ncbi:MAG: class II aldolase/adducin family protein [Acidimicrobiia bacterium]
MAGPGTGATANGDETGDGDEVRTGVAWACRILASEGYQDLTLGHVSARDRERPNRMWIKRRGVTLAEVTPADVIEFEIGVDLRDASDDMHLEAVLHTEVYRRREDVGAIVHGHPPYATAFAATDAELLQLTHDAVMFDRGVAVYDGSPDLITEPEQGSDVAEALGEHSVVLLRNHGVLVVQRDLAWMVLAAVTLERAVTLQSIAATLGGPKPIEPLLVYDLHRRKYNDGLVYEYWQVWLSDMRRRGLDEGMGA